MAKIRAVACPAAASNFNQLTIATETHQES